jgi:hypothetical protein
VIRRGSSSFIAATRLRAALAKIVNLYLNSGFSLKQIVKVTLKGPVT